MAVRYQLARPTPRVRQAKAKNYVVDTGLQKLQQSFAGDAAFSKSTLEDTTKLSLEETVLVTKLLFLTERDCIVRLFSTRPFGPVHAGRIILSLEGFGRPKKRNAITATHFCFRSGISAHQKLIVVG